MKKKLAKAIYRIYRVKYCTYPYVIYKGNQRIRQFPSIAEAKNMYPGAVFKRAKIKLRPFKRVVDR